MSDALEAQLAKLGASEVPAGDDGAAATLAGGVDDDVLAEFLDRLEAYDMACDIYVPTEFEGRIEVGDLRVGSAQALIEVLEALKEELSVEDADEDDDEDEDEEEEDDDDYEDEDDEPGELELIDSQIRGLWKVIYDGARAAVERKLPLYVRSA
jgi:hypothetical protein